MELRKENVEEIQKLFYLGMPSKITLNEESYYLKMVSYEEGIRELIGSKAASLFGLKHPLCKLISLDNNCFCILSKDLNTEGVFQTAENLGITPWKNQSLFRIWEQFDHLERDTKSLLNEIVKMYLMDILFVNFDRRNENWGVLRTSDQDNVVALDHDRILSPNILLDKSEYTTVNYDGLTAYEAYTHGVGCEDLRQTIKDNIAYFVSISSDEFVQMFNEYFNLCSPEYFAYLLGEVEKENSILTKDGDIPLTIPNKDELISIYMANYRPIGEVWRKRFRFKK